MELTYIFLVSKQPSVSSCNMHTAEHAWLSHGVASASPVTLLSTGDHHTEDEALFYLTETCWLQQMLARLQKKSNLLEIIN